MNTPAHAVFNILVLGRGAWRAQIVPLALGSVFCDAPMFFFYFWERHILERSQRYIWNTAYFDPSWQDFFDLFNSIPLLLVGVLIGYRRGWTWLVVFCVSMILHCVVDLSLHNDDAHRHFYPLLDWRFMSPVSYWDPAHYGHIFAPLEILMVVLGCVSIIVSWRVTWVRILGVVILVLYGLFIVAVYGAVGG